MPSITTRTFRLAAPYWLKGPERTMAWALGITLVGLVVLGTVLNLKLTELQKAFFDALEQRHPEAFATAIAWFLTTAVALVSAAVAQAYLEQALEMRWRTHLTLSTMARWLSGSTFYRIERDRLCDNPDQRLSEDTTTYVQLMIKLSLGFLSNLGRLGAMGWLLWQSAGPASFVLGGNTITIPGYLFWVAIGWGALQTVVTHLAGRRLSGVTVAQQSAEADFRFALAKVRDASEQIALYRGSPNERTRLDGLFDAIRRNWGELMRNNVYLNIAATAFGIVAFAVPIFAMAPHVLSGEISLGTLMQNVAAFTATSSAVAWLATSYRDLFQLSARVQRLSKMHEAMDQPPPQGITLARNSSAEALSAQDLRLGVPNGRILTVVERMAFAPGERWLVRGPSGCGKSTLLRAIAGLWPFSQGQITVPGNARLMFMPQKSYLPEDQLQAVMAYPAPADSVSAEACAQALLDCRLPHLVPRLGEVARWSHTLSPGEQQRLAFAQVLLNHPDVLFMDEATSALDNDTEAHLMRLVTERLPQCTLVSVAHRTTLDAFHDQRLDLTVHAGR